MILSFIALSNLETLSNIGIVLWSLYEWYIVFHVNKIEKKSKSLGPKILLSEVAVCAFRMCNSHFMDDNIDVFFS